MRPSGCGYPPTIGSLRWGSGLSNEIVEKLSKTKPETIGSASKIEGVTPAAINIILVTMKKNELEAINA